MSGTTKLIIAIAAIAIIGGVTAKTLLSPPTKSTPITAAPGSDAVEFDHSHQILDKLLRENVSAERVNYKAIKADPSQLNAYLAHVAGVRRADFDQWSEEQQLAMLINLYNAATIKLIIDHYPVSSIKDIGGLFRKPWKIESLSLFGQNDTLHNVEHEMLRKDYDEPRIHFAIVCAANGCPALRAGAFTPDQLDTQLREQGEHFMRDREKNRVDAGNKTIYLSKIFRWFEGDFEKGGTVIDFVKPYFTAQDAKQLENSFKIKYTDYDWSLNEQ